MAEDYETMRAVLRTVPEGVTYIIRDTWKAVTQGMDPDEAFALACEDQNYYGDDPRTIRERYTAQSALEDLDIYVADETVENLGPVLRRASIDDFYDALDAPMREKERREDVVTLKESTVLDYFKHWGNGEALIHFVEEELFDTDLISEDRKAGESFVYEGIADYMGEPTVVLSDLLSSGYASNKHHYKVDETRFDLLFGKFESQTMEDGKGSNRRLQEQDNGLSESQMREDGYYTGDRELITHGKGIDLNEVDIGDVIVDMTGDEYLVFDVEPDGQGVKVLDLQAPGWDLFWVPAEDVEREGDEVKEGYAFGIPNLEAKLERGGVDVEEVIQRRFPEDFEEVGVTEDGKGSNRRLQEQDSLTFEETRQTIIDNLPHGLTVEGESGNTFLVSGRDEDLEVEVEIEDDGSVYASLWDREDVISGDRVDDEQFGPGQEKAVAELLGRWLA